MSSNYSRNILFAFSICLWVFIAFFVSQYIVFLLWQAIFSLHIFPEAVMTGSVTQLLILAIAYVLALFVIVSLPRLLELDKIKDIRRELGIDKKPKILEILASFPGYVVYIFLTVTIGVAIQLLWPGFNVDQAQNVGFGNVELPIEYILAFIALVIIPPIAEEMLFRGYVFSRLRVKLGFWATTLVTSVLFGIVHLQWNVGVDVFALSLVLCFLREYTGHIWAGVALHMIKNGVAFALLFLYPTATFFKG